MPEFRISGISLPASATGSSRKRLLAAFALLLLSLLALPGDGCSENPPDIELYVTSWCPYCEKAIRYFKDRNLAVRIYNIERDPLAAERKLKLDPRSGVPLAVVNGQVVYGFSPRAYATALDE